MKANDAGMNAVLALLRTLIVLNALCALLFLGVLFGSFTDPVIETLRADAGAALDRTLLSVRAAMLLGLIILPFSHIAFVRLLRLVRTVKAGDPFVPENAHRLYVIAWCLLAIQVLDLGYGLLSLWVDELAWSLSLTGWLAVIFLFVLARVFAVGARLREELEGTV